VRSSREQRAINKGSRFGRARIEEAWGGAEVTSIQRARAAGVRVPMPHDFVEGVLVMELVKGEGGDPAPRMVDIDFSPEEAKQVFHILLREVVKMLCIGIVHADLSDFNVLMAADGPVIIDFPQAVDPASNQNARKLLIRDVANLTNFLGRYSPELRGTEYGPEMWALYERSELEPDTELTGRYSSGKKKADVSSLLEEILLVEEEARERREALGLPEPRRRARRPIPRSQPVAAKPGPDKRRRTEEPAPSGRRRTEEAGPKNKRRRAEEPTPAGRRRVEEPNREPPGDPRAESAAGDPSAPRKKRRRRRRKKRPESPLSPGPATTSAAPGGGEGAAAPKKRRRRRRRGPKKSGGSS
jgi:RIO kinase 1